MNDIIARGMAAQAIKLASNVQIFKNGGSYAFAQLPAPSVSTLNQFYTVTDSFVTDARFIEGAGEEVAANSEIAVVERNGSYYYNLYGSILTYPISDSTDVQNIINNY